MPVLTFAQEFTVKSLGNYGNVSVMEVNGNYDANTSSGSLNSNPREAIAKEFYKTHKDDYDFLVIFSNFDFQMPKEDARAFYLGVKNDTYGIGLNQFDNSSFFGSNSILQGTVDMGNISALTTDPLDPKFQDTLYILSHELMHRWGAHITIKDSSGAIGTYLHGDDADHWSYLLNINSVLYGNQWLDNGNGTFTSLGEGRLFSPLDLYLMGMIGPERVPPMFMIENSEIDPAQRAQPGTIISGTSHSITIEDIIAANGQRIPDFATSQKKFKTAFIFITQPETFTGKEIAAIENVRNGAITRFSILTDGASIMEVASVQQGDIPTNPGVVDTSITPRETPPNLSEGVQWLIGRQQADGSWSDMGQTTERDTAGATYAIKNFTDVQANYQNGVRWLTDHSSLNLDFLARKITALSGSGQDIASLVSSVISSDIADLDYRYLKLSSPIYTLTGVFTLPGSLWYGSLT